MHGLEVENIEDRRHAFDGVVVGEITAIRPHPQADKLRLAMVRLRPAGQPEEIVCGAPNIAIGQRVAVATLGTTLPNGVTIASRPIRGVVSNGMLCALDELGLGSDHSGILVLAPDAPVGADFATVMGFDDVVMEIAVPSNRADLLSVRGLARETSAILDRQLVIPVVKKVRAASREKGPRVSVKTSAGCPQYTARYIRNIPHGQSPLWMQKRLQAMGMRPIHVMVDVTNYMMLEYGQPLHAFDAAKVVGSLVVRLAQTGEHIVTIDSVDRLLTPETLVIADDQGPVAIAGVMGGQRAEVTETTTDVILEAAIFDPISIRRTARRLGLGSESSKRFERGLWSSLPTEVSEATAALMVTLDSRVTIGALTVVGKQKVSTASVPFDTAVWLPRLGVSVPLPRAKRILQQLGFTTAATGKTWRLKVPAWRIDVRGPEDILDDIGKVVGYAGVVRVMPSVASVPEALPAIVHLGDDIRDTLAAMGFSEMITHSYYSHADASSVGGDHVTVANPLDKTQQFLRRSLGPAMRNALVRASDAGEDAYLFEVGRVFESGQGDVETRQPWKVMIGVARKESPTLAPEWAILGVVHEFMTAMGTNAVPQILTMENKGRRLAWAEIGCREILTSRRPRVFIPPSEHPDIIRDVAVTMPADLTFRAARERLLQAQIASLADVTAIDAIRDAGQRGMTLRLVFQDASRTLTKDEVDRAMKKVITTLASMRVVERS